VAPRRPSTIVLALPLKFRGAEYSTVGTRMLMVGGALAAFRRLQYHARRSSSQAANLTVIWTRPAASDPASCRSPPLNCSRERFPIPLFSAHAPRVQSARNWRIASKWSGVSPTAFSGLRISECGWRPRSHLGQSRIRGSSSAQMTGRLGFSPTQFLTAVRLLQVRPPGSWM
jgi:hypothetical protein